MRKSFTVCFVVLIVLVGLLAASGDAGARRSAVAKKGSVQRAVPVKKARATNETKSKVPDEPCKAYIVMEANSGKILEEQNSHERRAPASMTKLMVADIVMEKIARGELHLTDKVRVSIEASRIGGSQVYLKDGEEFSLEDMMRAIMIASANDAAYAVSEFAAGSSRNFVDLMNEKAKALGMNDTEFASVHGLPPGKDQKEDMTSCHDMALLARDTVKYPKLLEWTSTKTGEFRDGKFILNNHNKLLSRMPEVDGLKTGYYSSTGFNVVGTARKGELRFIIVVMGSPSGKVRDDFAAEKLKKFFGEYTVLNLAKKGEQIDKDIILADGKYHKIKGVAAADLNFPLMRGKKKDVKKVYNVPASIKGEVKEGQKLGEVVYQLDNEVVGKVDIVSPVYVPKANLFMRLIRKTGLNL